MNEDQDATPSAAETTIAERSARLRMVTDSAALANSLTREFIAELTRKRFEMTAIRKLLERGCCSDPGNGTAGGFTLVNHVADD